MSQLNNNSISFLGLANEYCNLMEQAVEIEKDELIDHLLRLLPRLYITATDLRLNEYDEDIYLEPYLEEEYYDSILRKLELVIGEDDTYLEVFEEDMKYSDTPVAASVSECLADIFQDLYNLIYAAKDAPQEHVNNLIFACKENFEAYWGQTLCNVMRALHKIKYNNTY